ncbi:hypothetical protein HUJ05_002951 [Dendroctonus ponderosae]|nr:hypothetical protein HUJ05_002951 [Dendroctonus ponderosae]
MSAKDGSVQFVSGVLRKFGEKIMKQEDVSGISPFLGHLRSGMTVMILFWRRVIRSSTMKV